MSTTEDKATIEAYEDFDDYEGSYDVYICGSCGKYLTNSIDIALGYDTMPKTCPSCGSGLQARCTGASWDWGWTNEHD